jgi:hypothetical protein
MVANALIAPHSRLRREKVFGEGRPRALDRNAKIRIMARARALKVKTKKGQHYGAITAKDCDVLEALLWLFHNCKTGLCFPSYESIAAKAKCSRSHVGAAIKRLEATGLLTWVNRLKRVREAGADRFGGEGVRVRVFRTSNGYRFNDPRAAAAVLGFPSKSKNQSGTSNQDSFFNNAEPQRPKIDPDSSLSAALARFEEAFRKKIRDRA